MDLLSYGAPADCPTEAAFVAAVSERGARLDAGSSDAAQALSVSIEANAHSASATRSSSASPSSGQLARDAEVVAIEALHAKGSVTEASQRAARFLGRYPGDPHASRLHAITR